jgi:hypothetical protein
MAVTAGEIPCLLKDYRQVAYIPMYGIQGDCSSSVPYIGTFIWNQFGA